MANSAARSAGGVGGAGHRAGIGSFGGRGGGGGGRRGRVPHKRNHPPQQYPHQHPSNSTDPPSHRAAHRGGQPKANFAETVLRPAVE